MNQPTKHTTLPKTKVLRTTGSTVPIAAAACFALAALASSPTWGAEDFLRGNANVDPQVDLSDAVCILFNLFAPSGSPCKSPTCRDALDVDDNGRIEVTDPVYLLNFLYRDGPEPPAPGANFCGTDPTADSLDCLSNPLCSPPSDCPLRNLGNFGEHRLPDLSMGADGRFAIAWESDREADGIFDIRVGVYGSDGLVLIEPRNANSSNSGQQLKPAVGIDAAGGFVVVWEDDSNSNDLYNVRGRGFNADGTERFAQFNINASSRGQQLKPDVGVDKDGNFVVVWEDDGNEDSEFDVRMRGFFANGTERFPEVRVHVGFTGQQLSPRIAMAPSGIFVVAWEHDGNLDGEYELEARGFTALGVERFATITLHDRSSGQQLDPAIAINASGVFVAAWKDDRDLDGQYQIHSRVFNANGTVHVEQFTANVNSAGQQINPAVAINDVGRFAVAWESDRDNDNEYHVRCRRFTAAGVGEIDETKVDCVEPAQHINGAIGLDNNNRLQVYWDDIDSSALSQVVGRVYTQSGP